MTTRPTPADLTAQVLSTYGDPSRPNYFFVARAVERDMYRPLLRAVSQRFHVRETTDLNLDVGRVLTLTHAESSDRYWVLHLSFVGPYAAVLTGSDAALGGALRVVDAPGDDPAERQLFGMLESAGIAALGRDALETRVPLRLGSPFGDEVRLFQALFSDNDILPWRPGE